MYSFGGGRCTPTTVEVREQPDFSFYHVDPRNHPEVIRLGNGCL